MIKIPAMSRDPSDSYKIQAQSIPELKDGFDAISKRIAREIQFRGRKLRTGPLLNAVVVHYLRLSEEEQMRIAREGLAVYESLLDLDRPEDDVKAVRPREGSVVLLSDLPPGTKIIVPGGEAASIPEEAFGPPNPVVHSDAAAEKLPLPKRRQKRS